MSRGYVIKNKLKSLSTTIIRGGTEMKDYYSAKDVQAIAGISKSLAYEIIRKLKESFEKKYPEAISIQGKIPIWYFEEVMMNKKRSDNNEIKKSC